MKKKYSVVAFIDILGYKDLLESSKNREVEIFKNLKSAINGSIDTTIVLIKQVFKSLELNDDNKVNISNRIKYKQFSDNIYIYFDYNENDKDDFLLGFYIILILSSTYQTTMLLEGYYVRGGISFGYNFISKNFIFSDALVNAVKAEKDAIYPRIIIENKLKKEILKYYKKSSYYEIINKILLVDWAGITFLRPFLFQFYQDQYNDLKDDEYFMQNVIPNMKIPESEIVRDLYNSNKASDFGLIIIKSVRLSVYLKIREYKHRNYIQEKYVWLAGFLNWILHDNSNLVFTNFESHNK